MHHFHDFEAAGRPGNRRGWTGCDTRVRLVLTCAAVFTVVLSTRAWFGPLAAAACLVALRTARTPLRAVVAWLAGPLALAGLICLVQMFATGSTPLCSFDLGRWHLVATREGFFRGLLVGGRVVGSVTIVMTGCMQVPVEELFAALRWAKVPRTWIEIATLMYRYIFILFEQAASVVSAQKVRLGYGSVRQSFRSLGGVAGMVLLRSLDQAEKSHEAMVARGYRGSLPLPGLCPLSKWQWGSIGGGLLLIGLAYVLAERCPW